MCLALFHNRGYMLEEDEFDNAAMANSDGVGFAYYSKKNNIVIEKGTNIQEMKDKYYKAVDRNGMRSPFIVHFRLATHGTVSNKNCHPFRINQNTVMIHNGVLPVVYEKGEQRTDTQVFADEYLAKLPRTWFDDDYLFDMVSDYATGSKLVIMTNDPDAKHGVYIVNDKDGQWDNNRNRWFSNSSHCGIPRSWYKSGSPVGKSISTYDYDSLVDDLEDECVLCGTNSVLENMCFECGSCQKCFNEYGFCTCDDKYVDLHGMTTAEYDFKHGEPKDIR